MEETVVLDGKIKLQPYGDKYGGKHNGWAYQFLNDDYEGIHLGVCCKDFLNDIVWSELTQKSMKIYNQQSSYLGILDKQDRLKLAVYHKDQTKIDNIDEMIVNLQTFLNEIEILREFDLTTIETYNNIFIIDFSRQWIGKVWLLSLFTLLIRIGFWYNGNLEEYIKELSLGKCMDSNLHDTCDYYNLRNYSANILAILNNTKTIEQENWIDITNTNYLHNSCGVISCIANKKIKELEYVEN